MDPDKQRGMYRKYFTQRLDPEQRTIEHLVLVDADETVCLPAKSIVIPAARKHDNCPTFVLDPVHDPIARDALYTYAGRAAIHGYQKLADDVRAMLDVTAAPHIRALLAKVGEL